MAPVTTHGEFEVGIINATGFAEIYTCGPHVAHTIRVLLPAATTPVVSVKKTPSLDSRGEPLPPFTYTCKGCLEDWPTA